MKNGFWVLGILAMVVGGGSFAWVHWPSQSDRARHDRFHGAVVGGDATAESRTNPAEEVARLRSELNQKNALLLALVSTRKDVTESVDAVAAPQSNDTEPAARSVDMLDERMFTAPRDARLAAQMERELRVAVSSIELGDAKVSSLYCGSTLCKVTLSAGNETVLNRSMAALGGRIPKTFGATAVYEIGKGQSALYVGKSSQDLETEPAGEQRERGQLVMHEGSKPATSGQP